MARIRTIKPEFWKSESIAALPMTARLTFIGLWTYVDDNGVGIDNPKLVTAELYPLEDDPRETLASVQRDIARLAYASRILRYTVAGKGYLEIVNWREHQKIDRPGKSRYPGHDHPDAVLLTCENPDLPPAPKPSFDEPSRDIRESFATPHLSEQGTGSREQGAGIPPASASLQPAPLAAAAEIIDEPGSELAVIDTAIAPITSQTILAGWIDYCAAGGVDLPKRIIGQYAKRIKDILDSGVDLEIIKRALASMLADGVAHQPSWLDNRVVAVQTGPERRRRLTPGEESVLRLTDNGRDAEVVGLIANFFAAEEAAS